MNETQSGESAVATVEGRAASLSWWQRFVATFKKLGPAGPLALMTNFPLIGGFLLLGAVGRMAPWLRGQGGLGVFLLVVGFALSAGLSLLPTYACSVLAGWTFGFGVGLVASMGAFCLASLVAWGVNRVVAGDRVLEVVKEHAKWEAVRLALVGRGFWPSFGILTLVRIPPTSPFAMMNFIAATTRAPLGAYLLATVVGMTPRTAAVVWAASKLQKLDFNGAKGEVWMTVLGVVASAVVVTVIGVIANQAVKRVTRRESPVMKAE